MKGFLCFSVHRLLFTVYCILGVALCFATAAIAAESSDREMEKVLYSAESMFKAMKERSYSAIWNSLTADSQKTIVNNVYKASMQSGVEYSKAQISTDFAIGGLIAKTYWKSYLTEFDPDSVLEHSKWSIGFIKSKEAEINIQYKKSEKPALLQMYKEAGAWKVGLEETFGTRKYLDLLK